MRATHCLRLWLMAAVLTGWALPAQAADLEKYLLDDANFVLSVNVKQIVQSNLFTKQLQQQLEELLKKDAVQAVLKDTGFNPLKDVDHLLVVMGPKSWPADGDSDLKESDKNTGPLLLLQGRFDSEKIQAKLAKYAEDMPEMVKIHGIGKADVAEVKLPGLVYFGVVVDKNTVALSPRRDEIEDLLEKASGDRKTELKSADLQKLLKNRDAKKIVQLTATREAVFGGEVSVKMENGKTVVTRKSKTLADFGMESLVGGITLGAKLEGEAILTGKDADSAGKLAGEIETGLGQAKQFRAQVIAQLKDLAPLYDVLDTIKVTVKDKAITLSGHGGAEAIQGFFKAFLSRGGGAVEPATKESDK